mgnify:CR=1 FL=1
MAQTLRVNQLEKGDYIKLENKFFKVLEITHTHLGRGGANLEIKLQGIDGGTIRRNFKPDEEIEYIEIEKKPLKFLYAKKEEYFFKDEENKIFSLQEFPQSKYLKKDLEVTGYFYDDKLITIELPIKVVYEVKEAPPGVKGNTAQGGSKVVICENGLEVEVPLFINVGDKIIVNTQTNQYVSRA